MLSQPDHHVTTASLDYWQQGSDERGWRFGQGNTATTLLPHHGSVRGQRMADSKRGGWLKLLLTFACDDDHKPSGPRTTSMLPLVFELTAILALLAVGFVFGRMWEMRQEIRRRSRELDNAGFRIPTANLPTI
jgi:hypothetical protein